MGLFPGGVHPHEGKNGKAVNGGNPISVLAAPKSVTIPLAQHIGAPAKCLVKKGDRVLVGQKIGEAGGFVSAPVHSSVSGTVTAVGECFMPSGMSAPAVTIENDMQDEWVALQPADHPETLSAQELCNIVREAGIVGMGGATFPTSVKMTIGEGKSADLYIINAAECEPYLTADHRMMLEQADAIVDGVRLVMQALSIPKGIIGVEVNKPDAIEALRKAIAAAPNADIEVKALPVCYPQGGEKQLIYAVSKRRVPNGGLPLDVHCIVNNVGTVFAIDEAIRLGKPLVERVTTVGGLVAKPSNFKVRVGTAYSELIEAAGGLLPEAAQLLSGGPMMGMSVNRLDIPVAKGCSGLTVLGKESLEPQESACIRCGRCVNGCPMRLFPAKIDTAVRNNNFAGAEAAGVMNCIDCGVCTYVCPAKRNLVVSCRTAKKVIMNNRKKAAAKKEG